MFEKFEHNQDTWQQKVEEFLSNQTSPERVLEAAQVAATIMAHEVADKDSDLLAETLIKL